jgi:hypothetical protein
MRGPSFDKLRTRVEITVQVEGGDRGIGLAPEELVSIGRLSYPRSVMVLPTLEQAAHPPSREELLCNTGRHSNGRRV